MNLGEHLLKARKKSGLSQEEVAGRLGVTRQTISKWELNETTPDIYQSKKMASLYGCTLDELIEFDMDLEEIERVIEQSSIEKDMKIDWNKAWGKKYPILLTYGDKVDVRPYAMTIDDQLDQLKREYGFSELDAMLVLKDILARVWKARNKNEK